MNFKKNNHQSRQEYIRRINAVQDFIEEEINSPLSLEQLAHIAGFSKYHFHRIFTVIAGETVLQFINRIKLARSALLLLKDSAMSITDIALHYGFSDSAVYARSFRSYYGCSPSQYRKQDSKNCKKESRILPYDIDTETGNIKKGHDLMKTMPKMQQTLFGFAAAHNLLIPNETKILSIYHDNHEITDANKLRTSLCMTIPADRKFNPSGEIGSMVLSGTYVVGHFELLKSEYGKAWTYIYHDWLPDSGYQPRDTFPLRFI